MPIVAGIDEAGYGPLLGPLVVTGVAFEVPDEAMDQCLWQRLQASVTRRASKGDRRLPITDSKKLYSRKEGLARLERSALAMAAAAGVVATSGRQLLKHLAPQVLEDLPCYPWYRDFDPVLPLANSSVDLAMRGNAINKDLNDSGVRLTGVFSEPLLEGHFNRLVRNTRNKAVVSLGLALRIVQRVVSIAGGQRVCVRVDRQGGRRHYAAALMTAFDRHHLDIVAETDERSVYRLGGSAGPDQIEFITSGEDHHLPIALASIFSKYLRELFMLALNRYWTDRVEGLRPTAGYYQDAQRFLADIAPALERTRLRRDLLVRER